MKIKEDKKQRFSLRFSPFFCPDLGEDQKKKKEKGLYSGHSQIQFVFLPRFSTQTPFRA